MYLGVDFGTSYCQVAYRHNGVVRVLDKPGQYGVDSVFYYDKESAEEKKSEYIKRLKKEISENARKNNVDKTEEEIEKEVNDIVDKLEKWCFGIVGKTAYSKVGFDNEFHNLVREVKLLVKDNASFELDGKTFTAEEIIKAIYREVIFVYAKERGENEIPDFTIDGIVLTHPAGFEMPEVNTLCSAAKQCGCAEGKKLNVIGTIKEPVAAALSYYDANKNLPDGTGI
ncbi:MAG: hypothetical protein IKA02_00260, partial [Clostridia bacterium]|nr:hypothetical protein [Clostridia bacterium]